MREPKLLLNNDLAGKPEDIYLFLGRHPSSGIRQFDRRPPDARVHASLRRELRSRLLVLHDDGVREYAYGPAQGLPDSKVGTFPQTLYDEAKAKGWTVISMKNDWRQIFAGPAK